jgi:cytochrome P450
MNTTQTSVPVLPPMYPGRPLVGSAFELTRDRLAFIHRLSTLGGVVRFRMFGIEVFHFSSPDTIQHIMQDNARNYVKGKLFDPMRNLIGNGLFLSDGDFWLRQRRLMQPAFHMKRLALLVEGMANETQISIDRWAETAHAGQLVNMAEQTTELAMRVVTRALFSSGLVADEKRLAGAITVVLDEIAFRFDMPFYPPLSVPTPRNRRTRAAQQTINELVYQLISRRRTEPGMKDDLMAMLMEARDDDDGTGMNDQQLRDEVLVMFAAGHETTANAMAWTFFEIARNPEIMAKLRAEVDEVLCGRAPTAGDLPKLVYTRMVVEEALRLYPPVFITNRQAVQEDEVCGYRIPAGSLISLSPYSVQRDPQYWDDPETFDPDHFRPENTHKRPRFAYFPFGGGPRQCIGKDFALFEAVVVLAMTVQRFDWQLTPDSGVRGRLSVTFRPHQVLLMMKERG